MLLRGVAFGGGGVAQRTVAVARWRVVSLCDAVLVAWPLVVPVASRSRGSLHAPPRPEAAYRRWSGASCGCPWVKGISLLAVPARVRMQ